MAIEGVVIDPILMFAELEPAFAVEVKAVLLLGSPLWLAINVVLVVSELAVVGFARFVGSVVLLILVIGLLGLLLLLVLLALL